MSSLYVSTPQSAGLLVFLLVLLLNNAGIFLDAYLFFSGRQTITEYVWDCPILAIPILLLQAIAFVALSIHFTR